MTAHIYPLKYRRQIMPNGNGAHSIYTAFGLEGVSMKATIFRVCSQVEQDVKSTCCDERRHAADGFPHARALGTAALRLFAHLQAGANSVVADSAC